jgi:hypothetical protein
MAPVRVDAEHTEELVARRDRATTPDGRPVNDRIDDKTASEAAETAVGAPSSSRRSAMSPPLSAVASGPAGLTVVRAAEATRARRASPSSHNRT